MVYSLDDTIAAIATSIGHSGIGIVKISGPKSYHIAHVIFRSAKHITAFQPYKLHYGQIIDPETQAIIDEAMVVYMPQPHTYTCQDVVEIQAHGSMVALRKIMQLALRLGARLAEAGEMTLRAFLNGRIDLTQAEAVLDVIEAKTEAALRVATEQLSGTLSSQVAQVRRLLLDTLAFLEASIDFVEDDIPMQEVITPLLEVTQQLRHLLKNADQGLIYRQGIHAAIVGRPNVGKSSLLNALLRGERAIVTSIAGTTRDTLAETVNMGGIPLVLVDTAGIRSETADEVERIGIERSHNAIDRADLVLMVIDGSSVLEAGDWEIASLIHEKRSLLIINKSDLPSQLKIPPEFLPHAKPLRISALQSDGIEALEKVIVELVMGGEITAADTPLVSNPRHKALIQQSLDFTQSAIIAQQQNLSPDLVAIDVRGAVDALGEITGETVTEDLLDTIFSKFCIGK